MSKALLSILKNADIDRVKVNAAAGTGNVESDSVDMANYEGVIFLAVLGTITATGVPSIKAQQSSDDGSSDAFADLLGTLVTGDDADGDKILALEIYKPRERYVKCIVGRATANVEVDGIFAVKFGPRKAPVALNADVVAESETHVSPAEGTA